MEPSTRIEPVTSSLPKKCSTSELRGPNLVGSVGFEPTKASADRFTVCSHWPLGQLPRDRNSTPPTESGGTPTGKFQP